VTLTSPYVNPAQNIWQEEPLGQLEHQLEFTLPDSLAAHEPPEARGLARDGVRLLVSRLEDDSISHARFRHFPDFLTSGDLVVVNTSATINASLEAWREGTDVRPGEPIELHLSTPWPEGLPNHWVVELRRPSTDGKTSPLLDAQPGERITLHPGATAMLLMPYRQPAEVVAERRVRLWVAEIRCREGVMAFAAKHGSPIRYRYVPDQWPLSYYQTVFATEPGSAEMPSAGRAFSRQIVERIERYGAGVVPLVLHTGVASLESKELPYPERYRVPAGTAAAVNRARARGSRVVAVGTTVVRALETVASPDGFVHPGEGWTDLVITPERGLYTVNAMLTGLHELRSSHLAILEALAGRHHLEIAYREALEQRYLWHEFGDVHLIMPCTSSEMYT
jgi:S-adenosylmethionine:tRNA ribosyltransferase-isomerase